MDLKWNQNVTKMEPKMDSKRVPKMSSKMSQKWFKMDSKMESKLIENLYQNWFNNVSKHLKKYINHANKMVPKMNLLNEKYVKTLKFRFKCIHFGYSNCETLFLAFLIIILQEIAKDTDMRPTRGTERSSQA